MGKLNFSFENEVFEDLIKNIGWDSIDNWIEFCEINDLIIDTKSLKDINFNDDWIWGLLLPILSQAYKFYKFDKSRKIIGISALPGTGKSTLGFFLEKISLKLNFKITVISIDDFYLASKEMKLAVKDNPWNVSRGFPGSHSTILMKEVLSNWKKTGKLNVPIFDKSINNGLGDRSHWKSEKPDLLILEGWFLGVKPSINEVKKDLIIDPPLTQSEIRYRFKIQDNLKEYQNVWDLIDNVWHLKAEKFSFLNLWKKQQEKEMLMKKGVSLPEKNLLSFIRMLNVALPQKSFNDIEANFIFQINQERKLNSLSVINKKTL
ncbi:MAG: kinase [Prochlorococcus sp. SP3034]|nr:kinase [Prochlorococcus sp. SP3034]|tara:strand:+ start:1298 stop:2254 length:957 start_codon:yes stop_codon:yes gene_type:complete